MKVFLTGASGILGNDLVTELQHNNFEVLGFNSAQIDITDAYKVKRRITDFKPSVIIHAAAMTNVDLCEDRKDAAFLANVIGTENMAIAAKEAGALLVYISSCGVYGNGSGIPHREIDETSPLNYHHFTKLEGERRVRARNKRYMIIRPGWLFGGTKEHKKNFVEARRKEALNNNKLTSAGDKFGSPTSTQDLSKQIIELVQREAYGTFNIVNEGSASRFEYVSAIVKALDLNITVTSVSSDAFPRKAIMPDNEMLENAHLKLLGLRGMRSWQEALTGYIGANY